MVRHILRNISVTGKEEVGAGRPELQCKTSHFQDFELWAPFSPLYGDGHWPKPIKTQVLGQIFCWSLNFLAIFKYKKLLLIGRLQGLSGYISAASKDTLKIPKAAKNLAQNEHFIHIRSSWQVKPQGGNIKNQFFQKYQKSAVWAGLAAPRWAEWQNKARSCWFWAKTHLWCDFRQNRSRGSYTTYTEQSASLVPTLLSHSNTQLLMNIGGYVDSSVGEMEMGKLFYFSALKQHCEMTISYNYEVIQPPVR